MTTAFLPSTIDAGLLILRLALGLYMAAHGAQKLLGWFGGYGLHATGEFMVKLGFSRGRFFATLASATEVVSGLMVALGLLGPIGPALMISVMIVAIATVHVGNGFFATKNGIELPFLFAAGALAIALTGWGAYSLDVPLGLDRFWTPRVVWVVLALGIVGGFASLAIRRETRSLAQQH
jgi:putative oxidoreductase